MSPPTPSKVNPSSPRQATITLIVHQVDMMFTNLVTLLVGSMIFIVRASPLPNVTRRNSEFAISYPGPVGIIVRTWICRPGRR